MQFSGRRLTLLIAGLALAGPAALAEQPADLVLAEMGEPYFRSYCASCHGLTAQGDGPAAMSLRKPPPDLTRIAARRNGVFPDAEIAQFIDGRFRVRAHGPREMPIWGEQLGRDIPDSSLSASIARGKILVIVEYLKSIQVAAQAPSGDGSQ
jgi:mono/diheme cytochrome c family protein